MTSQLARLPSELAALKTEASELVSGLRESQFNWRPDQQKWSMAECLLHLNIVGDRYVRIIETALEEAKVRRFVARGVVAHGFLGKWILANTEPPPKRRYRSPRGFTPSYGQPITAVLPTFLHLQDQLTLQIERSRGLDLGRIKVPAPGLPVRFNLLLTLEWIAAHERRHLWQARQVRENSAFPSAQKNQIA
jgi:DinB superfamily